MYIIGDIHGCFDTLQALLKKLPDKETRGVCCVGDLIDRGPKSRQVVQFVKDTLWIQTVTGNHEQMMVDWSGSYNDMLWLGNGGSQCLDSYYDNDDNLPEKYQMKHNLYFNQDEFDKHKEWMKSLPIYLHFPDLKKDGKELVVSHSHISNLWDRVLNDNLTEQMKDSIIWGRPHNVHPHKDIFNIIGHTPVEKAKVKSFYANVDSGCFFLHQKPKYAHLTAISFPDMTIYTQECIDNVSW